MCHADQCLGLLPGAQALQVHHAVLGHEIVHIGAGVGHDAAVCQGGADAALQLAGLFIHKAGAHADKALAAVAQVSAQHKVQLAACTGNVLDACALSVHLAEQVDIHSVVDGDKVVQRADAANIIGVIHGSTHAGGVAVQEVIQLLGACTEGIGLAALVDLLVGTGDLAGHGDIHESIHIHFGVNTQILQVTLSDHAAHSVGHTADAQLQAGTVGNLLNDQLGHGLIHLSGGTAAAQLGNGGGIAFHDHIHIVNVNADLAAAKAHGHILVHFHDHLFAALAHSGHVAGVGAKVKVAVVVHGGNLEHGNIHILGHIAVVAGQLGIADGAVEAEALCHSLTLNAAHVPAVPAEMLGRVFDLEDLGNPHQNAAAELNILQFGQALCNGCIHSHGGAGGPAIVHPVTAFYQSGSLFGSGQFLLIACFEIHLPKPHFLNKYNRAGKTACKETE